MAAGPMATGAKNRGRLFIRKAAQEQQTELLFHVRPLKAAAPDDCHLGFVGRLRGREKFRGAQSAWPSRRSGPEHRHPPGLDMVAASRKTESDISAPTATGWRDATRRMAPTMAGALSPTAQDVAVRAGAF